MCWFLQKKVLLEINFTILVAVSIPDPALSQEKGYGTQFLGLSSEFWEANHNQSMWLGELNLDFAAATFSKTLRQAQKREVELELEATTS